MASSSMSSGGGGGSSSSSSSSGGGGGGGASSSSSAAAAALNPSDPLYSFFLPSGIADNPPASGRFTAPASRSPTPRSPTPSSPLTCSPSLLDSPQVISAGHRASSRFSNMSLQFSLGAPGPGPGPGDRPAPPPRSLSTDSSPSAAMRLPVDASPPLLGHVRGPRALSASNAGLGLARLPSAPSAFRAPRRGRHPRAVSSGHSPEPGHQQRVRAASASTVPALSSAEASPLLPSSAALPLDHFVDSLLGNGNGAPPTRWDERGSRSRSPLLAGLQGLVFQGNAPPAAPKPASKLNGSADAFVPTTTQSSSPASSASASAANSNASSPRGPKVGSFADKVARSAHVSRVAAPKPRKQPVRGAKAVRKPKPPRSKPTSAKPPLAKPAEVENGSSPPENDGAPPAHEEPSPTSSTSSTRSTRKRRRRRSKKSSKPAAQPPQPEPEPQPKPEPAVEEPAPVVPKKKSKKHKQRRKKGNKHAFRAIPTQPEPEPEPQPEVEVEPEPQFEPVEAPASPGGSLFHRLVTLVSIVLVLFVRMHTKVVRIMLVDRNLLLCYAFSFVFPFITAQLPGLLPPWVSPFLFYTVLMQVFCTSGPRMLVSVARLVLPVLFLTVGMTGRVFLTDLNGAERLLVAFSLASFRYQDFVRPMCLVFFALQGVIAPLFGDLRMVQWLVLVVPILAVFSNRVDSIPAQPVHRRLAHRHQHVPGTTIRRIGVRPRARMQRQ